MVMSRDEVKDGWLRIVGRLEEELNVKRTYRSRKSGFASPILSFAPFHVDPLSTFIPKYQ